MAQELSANATASPAGSEPLRLDDFRVEAAVEIAAYLQQLLQQRLALTLNTPQGHSLGTPLVEVDSETGQIAFDLPCDAAAALQASGEVLAIAYLDNIRLEFELQNLLLVHRSDGSCSLRAALPSRLYRFQRRQSYRVAALGSGYPRALLRHPMWPEMQLQLRLLDVSMGGLALLLPADVPEIAVGLRLAAVQVELDRDSHFEATLQLQHLSLQADGSRRLGCAFGALPGGAERTLQRYIDLTQKRQRLFKKA